MKTFNVFWKQFHAATVEAKNENDAKFRAIYSGDIDSFSSVFDVGVVERHDKRPLTEVEK